MTGAVLRQMIRCVSLPAEREKMPCSACGREGSEKVADCGALKSVDKSENTEDTITDCTKECCEKCGWKPGKKMPKFCPECGNKMF